MEDFVAGVDGCRGGWVMAWASSEDYHHPRLYLASCFQSILDFKPLLSTILVDIPIGLTEEGPRECDREARKKLDGRRSSVFPAPTRPDLDLAEKPYEEANRLKKLKKEGTGKGLTKQSFGIFPKVKEVDQLLTAPGSTELRERVIETHPELIFWAMNGGKAMSDSKKKAPGRKQRLDLLAKKEHFPGMGETLGQYCKAIQEDILDAYACLWAAIQYRRGNYQSVPDRPPDDRKKLPMRILYPGF